jgi:hypothetical protein
MVIKETPIFGSSGRRLVLIGLLPCLPALSRSSRTIACPAAAGEELCGAWRTYPANMPNRPTALPGRRILRSRLPFQRPRPGSSFSVDTPSLVHTIAVN